MFEDNIIQLNEYRRMQVEPPTDRSIQRDVDRLGEAIALLGKLGQTKRLPRGDQPTLVENIGRSVREFAQDSSLEVARKILSDEQWLKRKRYIRFPNDKASESARYAGSGGDFAQIIRSFIDVKCQVGLDRSRATVETVSDCLKGTSFRRASRFQIFSRGDDAVILTGAMEDVLNKFAQDADLASFFELISKYPIYPPDSLGSAYRGNKSASRLPLIGNRTIFIDGMTQSRRMIYKAGCHGGPQSVSSGMCMFRLHAIL